MDPLYFDASYYLTPEEPGLKAYTLLMKAMQETGYGAIAKVTMHQREHVVIIRPGAKGMTLHTMFYSNEIRATETVPDNIEVKEQEKKLAEQLIQSLAAPFAPQKYRDEYSDSVRAMIAAKLEGKEVAEAPQPHLAPVIDLMEALKKSLASKPAAAKAGEAELQAGPVAVPSGKKPPTRAVQTAAATQKRGKKAVG
jgi:DNA end-binding protein Ku